MDTALWPQVNSGGVVVKQMEGGSSSSSSSSTSKGLLERRARPQKDQALNCPRCNSTNTKFCYYNNYSLSQPRYFCKACRRYWTEGGSLRNVPVGGGSRKNKRASIPSSSSSDKKINGSDHHQTTAPCFSHQTSASQNPKIHHAQDLNLAIFPPPDPQNPNSSSSNSSHLSAMELLKSGMVSRGLTSFLSMPQPPVSQATNSANMYNTGGFPLHEFKPSLNFSLEGFESGYGGLHQGGQETETSNGQLMFPIEDLKQVSNTNGTAEFEQNRGHGDSGGYWNGMLGGGSW